MTEKEFLLDNLAELQRSYRKACQPYIDRLIYLESLTPAMPPIMPDWLLDGKFLPDARKKSPV